MVMMKRITTLLLIAGLSLPMLFAGGNIPIEELTGEWQLDREESGVLIYLKRIECHDNQNGIHQEVILTKLVNTTQVKLSVEWDMELWYDGQCRTCAPEAEEEYHYVVELDAGETVMGNCDKRCPIQLRYFIRFLNYEDVASLSNYEMANLKVVNQAH